jgi:hypothetical protein
MTIMSDFRAKIAHFFQFPTSHRSQPSPVVVLSSIIVGSIAAGWAVHYYLKRHRKGYPTNDRENYEHIDLITTERNNLGYAMSISCVDFFSGDLAPHVVEQQLHLILQSNPWLCSRLQTVNGVRKAVYPKTFKAETLSTYFKSVHLDIDVTHKYDDIVKALQPHEVPLGCFCFDKDIPLFQVVHVEIVPQKKYALLVSMSHNLGDGATFYQVFNMLHMDQPRVPIALNPRRVETYEQELAKRFSKQVLDWMDSSLIAVGVLLTICLKGPAHIGAFIVDTNAVTKAKQAAKDQSDDRDVIISTNDVLTSWILQKSEVPFGMMAINLRNRFPSLTDDDAGNYQTIIMYRKDDCRTPLDIRQSLELFRSKSNSTPTVQETIWFDFMGVSNWSTFYHRDLQFPHCQHLLHLPLMASNTLFTRGVTVIFRPRAHELGVIILDRQKSMDEWMRDEPLLLKRIVSC